MRAEHGVQQMSGQGLLNSVDDVLLKFPPAHALLAHRSMWLLLLALARELTTAPQQQLYYVPHPQAVSMRAR